MKILRKAKIESATPEEYQKLYNNKEAVEITTKNFSPIFKKIGAPIIDEKNSYISLAYNISCEVFRTSHSPFTNFTLKVSNNSRATIYIGESGDVEIEVRLPRDTVLLDDFNSNMKYLFAISKISEKDFKNAFDKTKKELQKLFFKI